VQIRVLLGLMYFTVLLPFAMLLRLQSNPLREAGWQKHESSGRSEAEAAQRQF
jgi:hypothetical protein